MNSAKIPVYIRFGEIPEDGKSKIHFGSEIAGVEPGVSVYNAIEADGIYYPVLPDNPNDSTILDYFSFLLDSDCKVYLVTGKRIRLNGHDNEPLLEDVKVIKDITNYFSNIYRNNNYKEKYNMLKQKYGDEGVDEDGYDS